MAYKCFVGNLKFDATEVQLMDFFSASGKVVGAKIVMDRDSGKSRGFAFVEMASQADVDNAISELDNSDFYGRPIRVSQAQDKPRTGGHDRGGPRQNNRW